MGDILDFSQTLLDMIDSQLRQGTLNFTFSDFLLDGCTSSQHLPKRVNKRYDMLTKQNTGLNSGPLPLTVTYFTRVQISRYEHNYELTY